MNKLIFIGGNRGVGKTSLATHIRDEFKIPYVQYSEFNIQRAVEKFGRLDWNQLSEPENSNWVNNQFIEYVKESLGTGGRLLIDGHYSYYNSPPFTTDEFSEITSCGRTLAVLVTASLEDLFKRIEKDKRDRHLSIEKISEDVIWNRKMFEIYSSKTQVERYTLLNDELLSAQKRLREKVNLFLTD